MTTTSGNLSGKLEGKVSTAERDTDPVFSVSRRSPARMLITYGSPGAGLPG